MTDVILTLGFAAVIIAVLTYYLRKYNRSIESKTDRDIKSARKRQLQSRKQAEKFFDEVKNEDADSKILKELKRRKNAK